MYEIRTVDTFINGIWEEFCFALLTPGNIFKFNKEDETIWIATGRPYVQNGDGILRINCEEFEGELEEINYTDKFCDFLKSIDDRIIALEKNVESITPNNYTININIENTSGVDINKFCKTINEQLIKMGA